MITLLDIVWYVPIVAYVAASVLMGIRWIRVAQREHYISGWTDRIARHWLSVRPLSWWPLGAATIVTSVSLFDLAASWYYVAPLAFAVGLLISAWWPAGMKFRGTSKKLQWTARAKRLAVAWIVLWSIISLGFAMLFWPVALAISSWGLTVAGTAGAQVAVGAVIIACMVVPARVAPMSMDAVLAIMKPIEAKLSHKWLVAAQKKLRQVRPTVIAVTGSYGKTSTKGYIAHLVGAKYSVVPSPASFNNLLGLSRAVNDKLTPGTEVFVAEMGQVLSYFDLLQIMNKKQSEVLDHHGA
ncbi:MAG: Mur ligase family protein [Microbacteriaceae bacterium]